MLSGVKTQWILTVRYSHSSRWFILCLLYKFPTKPHSSSSLQRCQNSMVSSSLLFLRLWVSCWLRHVFFFFFLLTKMCLPSFTYSINSFFYFFLLFSTFLLCFIRNIGSHTEPLPKPCSFNLIIFSFFFFFENSSYPFHPSHLHLPHSPCLYTFCISLLKAYFHASPSLTFSPSHMSKSHSDPALY